DCGLEAFTHVTQAPNSPSRSRVAKNSSQHQRQGAGRWRISKVQGPLQKRIAELERRLGAKQLEADFFRRTFEHVRGVIQSPEDAGVKPSMKESKLRSHSKEKDWRSSGNASWRNSADRGFTGICNMNSPKRRICSCESGFNS